MISGVSLEKRILGESILTAIILINLIATKTLKQDKTAYESWRGRELRVRYLENVGSTVYVYDKIRKTYYS